MLNGCYLRRTREHKRRKELAGVRFDGKIHKHIGLLARYSIVRGIMLFYGEIAQEIDAILYWNSCAYMPQSTGGGVYGHFAIEGGIERILGLEMQ